MKIVKKDLIGVSIKFLIRIPYPPVYIMFRVGPEWNRPSLPGEHAAHICGEI